ncbi:rhamnosyltransferase WsaF family glycosyltransferase [Rhizobium sp. GN54]|uniref:rhamnosyltransferase WsaF family glycosyltransferase n=1 Tax=Rhizobium sp. GN54 TaxID=2898150 RepID=UPI001E412AA3|nr:glycosyltransferase family 1 protein [Rhizobium sp. GN54]MCD2183301.1 glycosyltransferase family 1 protein [Rhizobium sp. GN54]
MEILQTMPTSILSSARRQFGRRSRQVGAILAKDGYKGIVDRARFMASDWVRPRNSMWEVFPHDVVAADLSQPFKPKIPKVAPDEPLIINWVEQPAGPGSGGHTTCYRMVKYFDRLGYKNRVYLYNTYGADLKYFEGIARDYYGLTCPIADVSEGMVDAHAVVATAWPTAYAVFNSRCSGKRFYFVQDYEPYFDPVGSQSVLAENTYRMGFHAITAGKWLAQKLSSEFDMDADYFPFGCDTSRYGLKPGGKKRTGVAFYARSSTPRRGTELGFLALEILAKRLPQLELHIFGEKVGGLPFKSINHGQVGPAELNDIYNQCFAGLNLSLTNVSLVPYEMLAAGCIPVVNDAEHNRMVLDNPHVRYAPATPHSLAAALEAVVNIPDFEAVSRRASESVASVSWDNAGAAVEAAFRRVLAA